LSLAPIRSHGPQGDERTCTIHYIQGELGRRDYGPQRLISYVALLIADHGFPAPLPTLRRKRGVDRPVLDAGVSTASRWHRRAVDQWIDDTLPPDAAAALDRTARLAAAAEMDGAACNLRLVRGSGGSKAA
jgi:hypothetical protein